uniref:RUN domain-containing protein n=1 Tax=Cyclopterus lumpus TaxID=8103 RepID=A0A8C2X1I5_CYCLU
MHKEFTVAFAEASQTGVKLLVSAGNILYHISFLLPQMRLGSSSRSPTIAGLVLEHLCPAIQNILEDGLRDHKLDLVIGQRRNNSWSVVETMSPAHQPLHET